MVRRTANRVGAVLTPMRAVAAVALVAVLVLAISQFLDYRAVAVGASDYSAYPGIASVTQAPEVDLERGDFGFLHAAVVLLLALAALAALARALSGRDRAGWALVLIGLIVIAIALAIDVPAGLDEGDALLAYRGAEADLESGFWLELVAAGVLVATGALIVRHAGDARGNRS